MGIAARFNSVIARLGFRGLFVRVLAAASPIAVTFAAPASATMLGANSFDLTLEYLSPHTPTGVEPQMLPSYRYIRRAMAKKAIADAADVGFKFLRVGVTGFRPTELNGSLNDLQPWLQNPAAFWAALDEMFDDLDRAHLQIVPNLGWNLAQFPAIERETVGDLVRNPNSRSRNLLTRFITEFVTRYKNRRTILFYELTNEMNLFADIDVHQHRCGTVQENSCVWSNFTTSDMNQFARDLVTLIKSIDPTRPISSGYSIPRPRSWHLMQHPQFAPGPPARNLDTVEQFEDYLRLIHQPFDIVSIHLYPGAQQGALSVDDQIAAASRVAKAARKPLFVGEFGDVGATPFMANVLNEFIRNGVDYAAVWGWELYQTSTYETRNTQPTRFEVEPGYSDALIAMLQKVQPTQGNGVRPNAPAGQPRVVLTWPLPCASVSRPIDVAAVASSPTAGVSKVVFLADGQAIGTATAPPYRAHFDPRSFGRRVVQIEARAYSPSGTTGRFASYVKLNGSDGPCRIEGN